MFYAQEIDSLVMLVRSTGGGNGNEKLAITRNQQWSVTALTDATSGTVLERYTYDHFGKRTILEPNGTTVRATSSYNMPFGYTSRQHDAETGLMYFRARYFDPHSAEFISPDPIEYVDGMSLFRGYFVPIAEDPSGSRIHYEHVKSECKNCGEFYWTVRAVADNPIDEINLNIRRLTHVMVQQLCLVRIAFLCETDQANCCVKKGGPIIKWCCGLTEFTPFTFTFNNEGTKVKRLWGGDGDDTFGIKGGFGDGECNSFGSAFFVTKLYSVPAKKYLKELENLAAQADLPLEKRGEVVKYGNTTVKIPLQFFDSLKGEPPLAGFSGAGSWNCCPKTKKPHCSMSHTFFNEEEMKDLLK